MKHFLKRLKITFWTYFSHSNKQTMIIWFRDWDWKADRVVSYCGHSMRVDWDNNYGHMRVRSCEKHGGRTINNVCWEPQQWKNITIEGQCFVCRYCLYNVYVAFKRNLESFPRVLEPGLWCALSVISLIFISSHRLSRNCRQPMDTTKGL